MKHDDIVALAKQAGFNGDKRVYDWCYTYHSTREFDDSYKQAFRLDITPEMLKFAFLVSEAERERACRIVTGLCISDNNAREINEAIRRHT